MSLHGLLLIDKPAGPTSFRVMREVQRRLSCHRAGHAGTLDPAATGLLAVLLGECTKLSDWVMAEEKVYNAEICFGIGTDTLDREGTVTKEAPVPEGLLSEGRLQEVLAPMVGEVSQEPPVFSAIKRDGRTLMSRARAGEEVAVEPRSVVCHGLEVLEVGTRTANIHVHCGKGYYVRSLARDLGAALGVPAHLSGLRRLSVGDWHVDAAVPPEAVSEADVVPIPQVISSIPTVTLEPDEVVAVRHGRQIPARLEASRAILTDGMGVALAMAVQDTPGVWRVQRGFRL